jgi:hypothetical protein
LVSRLFCLRRHISGARQRLQEGDEIVDLLILQIQRPNAAGEIGVDRRRIAGALPPSLYCGDSERFKQPSCAPGGHCDIASVVVLKAPISSRNLRRRSGRVQNLRSASTVLSTGSPAQCEEFGGGRSVVLDTVDADADVWNRLSVKGAVCSTTWREPQRPGRHKVEAALPDR